MKRFQDFYYFFLKYRVDEKICLLMIYFKLIKIFIHKKRIPSKQDHFQLLKQG